MGSDQKTGQTPFSIRPSDPHFLQCRPDRDRFIEYPTLEKSLAPPDPPDLDNHFPEFGGSNECEGCTAQRGFHAARHPQNHSKRPKADSQSSRPSDPHFLTETCRIRPSGKNLCCSGRV